MPNQEKATLKQVANFVAFFLAFAKVWHNQVELIQFLVPDLRKEEKSRTYLQCSGLSGSHRGTGFCLAGFRALKETIA